MSDTDDFGENPFRQLNAARFPAKRRDGASAQVRPGARESRGRSPKAAPRDDGDSEDAALFMAAMRRVEPAESGRRGGFRLADACPLGDVASPKKRRRGREKLAGAPAAGAPAPQPEEPAAMAVPDEDAAAFLRAMGDARRLTGRGREVVPAAETATPPPGSELSFRELMEGTLEFAISHSDEYLEGHVVGLDPLIMGRLRAGGLSPEAHLDLHGLNSAQAFEALRDFMRGAWYKSLRVVLVVPGRGLNSPLGQPVLREKLQLWLTQEPFKRVVLAFCTARPHDGGPGSVYVLLRKFRKKGRIFWERMPMDPDLV
ncbi:Smr/MutS family protein [Desulfovibrio sp.]|uniref:Smr/MutS family protein n=1 Tax=Desulfovibrio sp. TaxID=885 RepID=UPI0023C45232|nr:Smr/MutS family protein [Desulfovibrio sp.]MDE7241210.1 Smr/MutS family protein [Desulfovibrio sp.]